MIEITSFGDAYRVYIDEERAGWIVVEWEWWDLIEWEWM